MSTPVIEIIQTPPAPVVQVVMPGGLLTVESPLVYDAAMQRLSLPAGGLPVVPAAHKASHAAGGADALSPADIGAEAAGAAATAIAAHLQAADPHPAYTTQLEAAAAAPVQSVAGKVGAVILSPTDVGADAAGSASAAVTAHAADPTAHPQYISAVEAAAQSVAMAIAL